MTLPTHPLETGVVLRPLEPADAPDLLRLITANRAHLDPLASLVRRHPDAR